VLKVSCCRIIEVRHLCAFCWLPALSLLLYWSAQLAIVQLCLPLC
jgi:hypothetical protein